jgi:hypothetical protein
MTNPLFNTNKPTGKGNPGLVIVHNPESENFLMKGRLKVAFPKKATEPLPQPKLKRVRYRNWWTKNDQGQTPRCTSFGTLTNLACTPITHPGHNPLSDPQKFYEEIQANDRAAGYNFDEGATADSAMKAARDRGYIKAWWHGYTIDDAHRGIMEHPLIAATLWYPSMFDRDAEGIVKIGQYDRTEDGHLYTLNEYNPARGLWRIAQTWGDGNYFMSDETLFRLIHEAGEIIMVDETVTQ